MKKIIPSIIVLFLLLSCSKKEQYYGAWAFEFANGTSPTFIKIVADSISFSESKDQWNTYPVSIKNNSLTFLNHTFKTVITKDSLVLEGNVYKKDTTTSLLDIKLPELKTYRFLQPDFKEKLIPISYGKVPSSDEFKLQLNDRYAEFWETLDYFYNEVGSCSKLYSPAKVLLICDENTRMKDLELLFHEMVKMNAINFYTVNHIDHEVIDTKIEQKYFCQKHRITPILNMNYEQKTNNNDFKITYNILNYSILKHLKLKNTQYLFLVNNEFYIGKEKYNLESFTKKIDSIVTEKSQLISLFDLYSDYKHFTIFNAVINDAYSKRYDSIAKQKYNTSYEQLNNDEKNIINALYPKRNIQNISIPHFLSFEESPDENVEFPFKNIKEQIPTEYFKQLEK